MRSFFIILVGVVCLGTSCNSTPKEFLLLFENTENGVKISSREGCAFSELAFNLKEGEIQEINQWGMSDPNDKVCKSADFARFRITIKKVKNGFILEGIEGTTWKKLSFDLPINGGQWIDRNGMRLLEEK